MSDFNFYAAVAAAVTLVGGAAGVVTWVYGIERSLRRDWDEHREVVDARFENIEHDMHKLDNDIVKSGRDVLESMEGLRRETGEIGLALRTKIHDFELFVRDHFVTIPSFDSFTGRIESTMEKRFDALDKKVDTVISGNVSRSHDRGDR